MVAGVGVCHLDNYVSSCILDILEEHIEATAVINHCHLPLDITFLIAVSIVQKNAILKHVENLGYWLPSSEHYPSQVWELRMNLCANTDIHIDV